MSLDILTNSSSPTPPMNSDDGREFSGAKTKRSLAWLLPFALLVGFILIMALLFGNRLIPALEVRSAPVITLKLGNELTAESSTENETSKIEQVKGNMIFQASGWIEPDPYITYVPTLINGVVNEVFVLAGDFVKKGQTVATLIDDDAILNFREAEQRVKSLEAQVIAHCTGIEITKSMLITEQKKIDSQKAQLAEAEDNLARLQSVPAGTVSRQQVVQAELRTQQEVANLAEAESMIAQLNARIVQIQSEEASMQSRVSELKIARDRAKLALDRTQIKSPMDGVVLHRHAAPGKKRMLDMDDPKSAVIVELYDPNKLQARIDVPLTEASALVTGQSVELVSDLLPNVIFTGEVTSITGEADLQRNTLQAKVSIINPDSRLRPEMLLRAKFFSGGSNTASSTHSSTASNTRLSLFVPESAIVKNSFVWVISENSRAELRSVSLATETRDTHRRVLTGLRSGEQVILPPHQELKNGKKVKTSSLIN
ncbi:MAG: efflux RND transporter periplasmic adaptor subunit [Akkermansiaceae bacterium]